MKYSAHNPRPLPPLDYLKECFSYDRETGVLTRKKGRLKGKEVKGINKAGYYRVMLEGVSYNAHRIVWKMVHGSDPEHIDHINGVQGDNRVENLRNVTHQENHRNTKRKKNNRSGVTGVQWADANKKWRSTIFIDGQNIHLGLFTDKIDAIYARYWAERDAGYHENHGRV